MTGVYSELPALESVLDGDLSMRPTRRTASRRQR